MREVIRSAVSIQQSLSKVGGHPFQKPFESQLLISPNRPFVSSVVLH